MTKRALTIQSKHSFMEKKSYSSHFPSSFDTRPQHACRCQCPVFSLECEYIILAAVILIRHFV